MKLAIALFAAFLVLLLGESLVAQEISGNIEGYLVDQNGDPVTYANIYVTSPSLLGSRGALTSTKGYFIISKSISTVRSASSCDYTLGQIL